MPIWAKRSSAFCLTPTSENHSLHGAVKHNENISAGLQLRNVT